jgi:SAM-dependent methyltransferase
MESKIYKQPLYYEIAFSFVNAKMQVDLFEKYIKKFSRIKVKRFLDIGCGPSLQLKEIARRGYEAVGLDLSSEMLRYLKQKAVEEGIKIETVKANMINFKLKKKVDFAFIMMGTIGYISSKDFLNHLDSVAASLKSGGLYLIEDFRLDWTKKDLFKPQSWIMKRNGIKVKTTFSIKPKDTINQMLDEAMKLEVNDNGKKCVFQESSNNKMMFPQEFLELVKMNNKFEFLDWFERFKFKALKKANNDNIAVLRRK